MGSFHASARAALWLLALFLTLPVAMAQSQIGQAAPLRLVLSGYDPVAYFTDGKPTLGKAEFETQFDGGRYRFVSSQHMELFKADPDHYAPQFGGSCAGLMSKNMKVEADPKNWIVIDDKLYVFLAPVDKQRSREEFDRLAKAARANWRTLKDKPFQ